MASLFDTWFLLYKCLFSLNWWVLSAASESLCELEVRTACVGVSMDNDDETVDCIDLDSSADSDDGDEDADARVQNATSN